MVTHMSVVSVASVAGVGYNDGMPRTRDPNEITATEAANILGMYRQYFYDLVKAGRVRQYRDLTRGRRPYYLRSEIEALKAALAQESQMPPQE